MHLLVCGLGLFTTVVRLCANLLITTFYGGSSYDTIWMIMCFHTVQRSTMIRIVYLCLIL